MLDHRIFLESINLLPKVSQLPDGYSTKEDVMENLLVIEILFTSMQVSEIREIVTYGWGNFLGDVGGVLGLFLGASMFTILEFTQFITFSVAKWCFGYKNGRNSTDTRILIDDVPNSEMPG